MAFPLPSVAVLGAGSSGIAALKALDAAGLGVTCFEKGDRVGGNWVFGNSNGMSSSYRSLHINTSRERMAYSDLPMPAQLPDFPHHTQIAAYFDSYVDHFGFRDRIRFGTTVEQARRTPEGRWQLALAGGERTEFDALVVANGHHWDARWPEPAFPGSEEFPGEQAHAHSFTDNAGWRDKRVLVLGMGNSAMDIAVEASWVARRTLLAARTPAHVLPKYVFGRPLDTLMQGRAARLPWRLRQRALDATLRAAVGSYETYGLRTPAHGVLQAHPTISDTILSRLAHGAIAAKPTIERFEGSTVVFADGSREEVDVVVYCTGYRISFPFFDAETAGLLTGGDGEPGEPGEPGLTNEVALYQRVFPVADASLAVVGLVQPLGAIMPLAEAQGQLVAAWLRGRYALPAAAQRRAEIEAHRRGVADRYVGSKRHTIQVDFDAYLHGLGVEQRRGLRRAAAAGYPLPVRAHPHAEPTPHAEPDVVAVS